jgi:hypothetical protein
MNAIVSNILIFCKKLLQKLLQWAAIRFESLRIPSLRSARDGRTPSSGRLRRPPSPASGRRVSHTDFRRTIGRSTLIGRERSAKHHGSLRLSVIGDKQVAAEVDVQAEVLRFHAPGQALDFRVHGVGQRRGRLSSSRGTGPC